MQVLINSNRERYAQSIHSRIEKEQNEVVEILNRNKNFGHHVLWDYRNDNGGEMKDPGDYLTVITHPVAGVYRNSQAVTFLRKLEKERNKAIKAKSS